MRIKLESALAGLLQFIPTKINRKFQAYCIGLPRSGTHSLAYMFSEHYSSFHEPAPNDTISHLLNWLEGKYSDKKMKQLLVVRDKYLHLEFEASHYLHHTVELLVDLFPESKFILTIRNPLSWLESEVNQSISSLQGKKMWQILDCYRYGRYQFKFEPEEKILQNFQIYPIAAYLSYWRDHIKHILAKIPQKRIFLIKIEEISSRIPELAEFISIDPQSININRSHFGKRKIEYLDLYDSIDKDFVIGKVLVYCQPFVKQFYPKILNDIQNR